MNNADFYRERPTGEILKEQKELEKLRQYARQHGEAWWEWDGDNHCFNVSEKWEELTGYEAAELFPSKLSKRTEIEDLLPHYIERWLKFVEPGYQEEAKKKAYDFLIDNATDNYFDYSYLFRFKDGEYRFILTTARSVWEDERLSKLFVQTRKLNVKPESLAVQAVRNKEAIEQTQEELTKATNAIAKTKKIANAVGTKVKGWVPIVLAAVIAFGESGGWGLLKSMKDNISFVFAPPNVEQSQDLAGDEFDLDFLTDKTLFDLKQIIQRYAVDGEQIKLGVYTPGIAPEKFRRIFQYDAGRSGPLMDVPTSVSENGFIAARTENHLNREKYSPTGGPYSVPLLIERDSRRWQVFFVESTSEEDAAAAAKDIQEILERATAPDENTPASSPGLDGF